MPRASGAMKRKGPTPRSAPFFMPLLTTVDPMGDVDRIRRELLDAVAAADSREALEQVRVAALGRKGRITELMKGLGGLAAEARKGAGTALNRLKDDIAAAIDAATGRLAQAELGARLAGERLDVTL